MVAEGTPEEVATVDQSYTGQFLKKMLGRRFEQPQTMPKVEEDLVEPITARSDLNSTG